MPYAGLDPSLTGKVEKCVEEVMAKGHDKSSAIGICRASIEKGASIESIREVFALNDDTMAIVGGFMPNSESVFVSERVAFEPFASQNYSKPFRVLPLGKWFRGNRVLEITDKICQQIADNFRRGLPRYGVHANVEHGNDMTQPGRVGAIKNVRYIPGDGVYAEADFTDSGRKLLDEERYQGISPEIVWSLNQGAKYQDPQTGQYHDNVLVGLALTTSPFFGEKVAVFSAKESGKSP